MSNSQSADTTHPSLDSSKKNIAPKPKLTNAQIKVITNAFNLFDTNLTGFIEDRDLKLAMSALGIKPKDDEIEQIVTQIDPDNSGRISINDFQQVMATKLPDMDSDEEMLMAFRFFDVENTGKISFDNLKRVARELGEALNDDELRAMITEADLNLDGEVDQEEFLNIMRKRN